MLRKKNQKVMRIEKWKVSKNQIAERGRDYVIERIFYRLLIQGLKQIKTGILTLFSAFTRVIGFGRSAIFFWSLSS